MDRDNLRLQWPYQMTSLFLQRTPLLVVCNTQCVTVSTGLTDPRLGQAGRRLRMGHE